MRLWREPRVALVTAASRGIGRAVAELLAAEGARVVICARGGDALDAACREIGGDVLALPADVTDPDAVTRLVAAAEDRFGRIDIVVANGGGPPAGQTLDHDEAQWRSAYETVALAPLRLARATIPVMAARGWGRFVAISSVSVKQPLAAMALSNSARLATLGWCTSLAQEVAASGVTVNTVCPGWTRTERVEEIVAARAERAGQTADRIEADIVSSVPMRRLLDPAEVAATIAFLASDGASGITGAAVPVDGGLAGGY